MSVFFPGCDMPNIAVSDYNKGRIESLGGFGSTHDGVLGDCLDAIFADPAAVEKVKSGQAKPLPPQPLDPSPTSGMRAKKGSILPVGFYKPLILKFLLAQPGREAASSAVLDAIEPEVRKHGTAIDFEPLPKNSGTIRWRNKCMWARQLLVQSEDLTRVMFSGFGRWRLTKKGIEEAKKLK